MSRAFYAQPPGSGRGDAPPVAAHRGGTLPDGRLLGPDTMTVVDISRLPGADLVIAGLADARAGRVTVASLLLAIGAERMRDGGLDVPPLAVDEPEIRLYELLAREDSDSAHSRYNALIRQLVSFERALSCAA